MKLEIEQPTHLVDISRLPLKEIEDLPDGGLRIGAQAANSDVAGNRRVRTSYQVLSQALIAGASGSAEWRRSAATCCSEPAAPTSTTWAAIATAGARCGLRGDRRFQPGACDPGASDACIATHPSDMAVAMTVLDAQVEVLGAGGTTRRVAIGDFHRLPGDSPHIETVLGTSEMLTGVLLPPRRRAATYTARCATRTIATPSRWYPWRPSSRPREERSPRHGLHSAA